MLRQNMRERAWNCQLCWVWNCWNNHNIHEWMLQACPKEEMLYFLPATVTNLQPSEIRDSQWSLEVFLQCCNPLHQQIWYLISSREQIIAVHFTQPMQQRWWFWWHSILQLKWEYPWFLVQRWGQFVWYVIVNTMSHHQFIDLQMNFKLNNSNKEIKHEEDGCDPS